MAREPGMAYNTKTLNKIFAVISIIFLTVTLWVFLDDFIRPWKFVQFKAMKIKKEVLSSQLKSITDKIDPSKIEEVKAALQKGREVIKSRAGEITKVEEKLNIVKAKLHAQKLIDSVLNANVSETTYKYEIAAYKKKKSAGSLKEKLDKLVVQFAHSKDQIKGFKYEEKQIKSELETLQKDKLNAEKMYTDLLGVKERLEKSINKSEINFAKDPENAVAFVFRNAPFVDFLDPSLKVHQVVLKNYVDDRYFKMTEKVDRCMTCHTFIDKPGYEEQSNPYKTHPNLELMVGAKSPHPMKEVGCTNCHGGEGHRVTNFNSAAHIPQDEEQKKEWVKNYHWHAPHKVPKEMYRLQYTESQCFKCHSNQHYIPQAETLNTGKELVEVYGCYACHKIKGFEGKPRPGPSLKKIASKVSKEWIKNWVWNPSVFNEHAKMPKFFENDNNTKPEHMVKNIAEVNAMAEVLVKRSGSYAPKWKYSGGNKERGKELIQTIGCVGCHQVQGIDSEFQNAKSKRGPYLANLGSKVKGDWLVSWLIKPDHYQEDTIMPSFRLTSREANDMAAFLLSFKNKKFDSLKFSETNSKARDDVLLDYFSAFDTLAMAKQKLGTMNDRARTLELGRRSLNKYGCYSCHDISGIDGPPIGPELVNFGNKPLAQIGFGHQHIEHRRDTWLFEHVQNPRQWDIGVERKFKDLLRMPVFPTMTKDQASKITTFVLGQLIEVIPQEGLYNPPAHVALARRGEAVVEKYNCKGCHMIDGHGGEILKNYEDINEGPPQLNFHGARVQSDWLHYFLGNVYSMRGYNKVRMPSFNFSSEEKNAIVSYFQNLANKHAFTELPDKVVWAPGEKAQAKKLWDALACTSCHSGGFTKEEELAPNLKFAKRKLRPEWIEQWLKNPQKIIPGTVMPNFWEDGESQEPDILGGDVDRQVTALKKLILDFGEDKYKEPISFIR